MVKLLTKLSACFAVRRRIVAPKPTVNRIPKGFTLIIDSSEQQPLFSRPPEGLTIVRKALSKHHDKGWEGDYTIEGYEDKVAIERKKISDLYGYFGEYVIGRVPTKGAQKIHRLANMKWAALIIESTETKLNKQYRYTTFTPAHIHGFIVSLRVRYGIHVYVSNRRNKLEEFVLKHLIKVYNILQSDGEVRGKILEDKSNAKDMP